MKQIKNLVCSLLLSVCGATMFTACSEDNEAIDAKDLELSKSELVFLAEPGEAQTVTFTANADWKATSEQGWILIDTPVGKKGESTVSVSVKQNPEKVLRQGNVIITEPSTGKMASFKVTQEAEGVNFAVNKETGELAIDNENKVISDRISVVANFDYDIQIKDVDWVTYSIDEATKDIIFYADNEKATIEAKDIVVNFVPEEENVEVKSWTLKWGGFTPTVEFYTDEECLNLVPESGMPLEETMNGIQAKVYVKSNTSWTVKMSDVTMLKEVSNGEDGLNLPRVFTNVIGIFTVFDENKLDSEDKTEKLSFSYEGSKTAELNLYKAGVGNNYLQIDKNVFAALDKDINGTGFPMFPATAENGDNSKLTLRFSVRSTLQTVHAFVMRYDYLKDVYTPVTLMDQISVSEAPAGRSLVSLKDFILTMPDRSQSSSDDGMPHYFKLFVAESKWNDYFEFDSDKGAFSLKEGVTNITEGVTFGQFAYEKEYTFESDDISKESPVLYTYDSSENTLKIEFTTDYMDYYYSLYDEVQLSDDKKYVEAGILNCNWIEMKDLDPGKSITLTIKANEGEMREVILHLGIFLGDGKSDQYLGAFKIQQAAASSTTK